MRRWFFSASRQWVCLCAALVLAVGEPAMGQGAEPPPSRSRLRRVLSAPWSWSKRADERSQSPPKPLRDDQVRLAQNAAGEAPDPEPPDGGSPTQEAPADIAAPPAPAPASASPEAAGAAAAEATSAGAASPEGASPSTPPDLTISAAERALGGGGPTETTQASQAAEEAVTPEEQKVKHLQDLLGFNFDDDDVKVYGWIQQSYTGNANGRPKSGANFGVNPNNQANAWQLNQLYIIVENPIEQGDKTNFGFRVDNIFGRDWIFDYNQGMFNDAFSLSLQDGYNMPQLYGEAHFPILTEGGIDVKGGKFYSIVGYEQVPAVSRPLLSVPYMFNYGQPFTHVGVLTTLHLTSRVNLYNGAINGWDRWINPRYLWGYIGGFSWTSKDAKTTLATTSIWGPNQFPDFLPANQQLYLDGYVNIPSLAGLPNPGYARNTRTIFTSVGTHEWTKKLTQVIEADQAWELSIPGLASGGRNGAPRTATWFSFGNWFLYEFTPKFSGVWRSEIFWDPQGARLQNMANGQFVGDRYHEITLGGIWKPNPNLWIRPEARYDWTQFHKAYNDGTRKSQLTLAFDVVLLW